MCEYESIVKEKKKDPYKDFKQMYEHAYFDSIKAPENMKKEIIEEYSSIAEFKKAKRKSMIMLNNPQYYLKTVDNKIKDKNCLINRLIECYEPNQVILNNEISNQIDLVDNLKENSMKSLTNMIKKNHHRKIIEKYEKTIENLTTETKNSLILAYKMKLNF